MAASTVPVAARSRSLYGIKGFGVLTAVTTGFVCGFLGCDSVKRCGW
jgi:hypothetical protein